MGVAGRQSAPPGGSLGGGLSGKMPEVTSSSRDADVLVIGAGPGGTTTATFLAQGGLRVAVIEREAFPRFKVGESLIPTCMDICKRLGVLDRVLGHGFQVKYGRPSTTRSSASRRPSTSDRGGRGPRSRSTCTAPSSTRSCSSTRCRTRG
jgi:Tryptophan halogenase